MTLNIQRMMLAIAVNFRGNVQLLRREGEWGVEGDTQCYQTNVPQTQTLDTCLKLSDMADKQAYYVFFIIAL